MQRGTNDTGFIKDDANRIIGVNLGRDITTEHECGIMPLVERFGLPLEKELGFEARRNTLVPKQLSYREKETAAIIYYPYPNERFLDEIVKSTLRISEREELSGAWDESSFGANAVLHYKETIRGLYEAFLNKNGVIMFGGRSGPFSNPGLLLLDYSMIPEELKAGFRENDRKKREEKALYRRLEKESGVFEALAEHGKTFLSLSIRGIGKDGEPRWWLNPLMQRIHNAGSFTTEELIQWANDEGPIIRK